MFVLRQRTKTYPVCWEPLDANHLARWKKSELQTSELIFVTSDGGKKEIILTELFSPLARKMLNNWDLLFQFFLVSMLVNTFARWLVRPFPALEDFPLL